MDALDLLTTRRSVRELVEPAPDELELETVFQAASTVAAGLHVVFLPLFQFGFDAPLFQLR